MCSLRPAPFSYLCVRVRILRVLKIVRCGRIKPDCRGTPAVVSIFDRLRCLCPVLLRGFYHSSTHVLCCFMWGVSLTCPMLFYVGSFFYTPLSVLCGEFLLHTQCCFLWGVSLTHPVLFPVGSFSYTLDAILCGEFLLHASCCST